MGSSSNSSVFSPSLKPINDAGMPLTPQMQNMYPRPPGPNMPYTPTNTQANTQLGSGMPPLAATPQSGPIRPRYPQQVFISFFKN